MGSFFDLFIFFLSNIPIIIQFYGLSATAQPQSSRVFNMCSGSNYTANSTYQANLNLLLSSLSSSNNTIFNNGYRKATIGQSPNTIYGSSQCRGDATSQICQDCVEAAAQEIIKSYRCPNSKQGIIWYDEFCILRYSDQSFFSIMLDSPTVPLSNNNNATDPKQFSELLDKLMDGIIKQAISHAAPSSSSNNSLFATGDTGKTTNLKIYGLVQCTSDLSNNSCNTCLRGSFAAIQRCCDGKKGGRVVRPSCYLRYEMYPFYESDVTAPPSTSPLLLPPSKPPLSNRTTNTEKKSSIIVLVIVVPLVLLITALSTITIWYCCYLKRRKASKKFDEHVEEIQSAESLQFKLSTIIAATNNFSDANKLGRGGFGSVYKGTLPDGQEVAVKRLSKSSGQGEEEFKNEVVLLVKLQHINLVRLLGFCLDGEEKLLIYEFMPNGSLDQLIFDPVKRTYLDWEKRYKIIGGIARGLLYLHEDSRLKIIHRDLKASNVLLGADMIPKISDFGMARIFMLNQTQASTNRICGTYGYMAPEYAMHGQFSVKSDVFSFGILVLEILIGKRSNSFTGSEDAQNLLSYAWRHWREGTAFELLDPTLKDRYSTMEVTRCIHIGLLCVQEDVGKRPTMTWIIHNLNNYSVTLPSPSSPSTFFVRSRKEPTVHSGESENTANEVSITELYPR